MNQLEAKFLIFAPEMPDLFLSDFSFELPEERIAAFPLEKRDISRLLFLKGDTIGHRIFSELPSLLPAHSLLVFNDTRVIPARIFFQRATGARIEVLLLEPANGDVQRVMQSKGPVVWNAIVGGLKKWKDGETLSRSLQGTMLNARLVHREGMQVELSWEGGQSLSEILEEAGKLPLPPYIKRETEESDKDRYQTVYAEHKGAVAAPTAGLHFTDQVLEELTEKGIQQCRLTLHVGAGTFKPIQAEDPREHDMHNEKMRVPVSTVKALLEAKGPVIPVGTTSMRTLESLYWWGCKLETDPETPFFIHKLEPYSLSTLPLSKALKNIIHYALQRKLQEVEGQTEILIVPGYRFAVCQGLITNFHLPETTLILLVAAFIGEKWREVYQEALDNGYRFLSFGDSSLLLPSGP